MTDPHGAEERSSPEKAEEDLRLIVENHSASAWMTDRIELVLNALRDARVCWEHDVQELQRTLQRERERADANASEVRLAEKEIRHQKARAESAERRAEELRQIAAAEVTSRQEHMRRAEAAERERDAARLEYSALIERGEAYRKAAEANGRDARVLRDLLDMHETVTDECEGIVAERCVADCLACRIAEARQEEA